jgi:hypothetical protein
MRPAYNYQSPVRACGLYFALSCLLPSLDTVSSTNNAVDRIRSNA